MYIVLLDIVLGIAKIWHRQTQGWADTFGKPEPTDLFDTGWSQTVNQKKKKNAIICEAGVGLHPAVLGDLYLSKFKTEERTGVSNRDNGLRQGSANPCAHPWLLRNQVTQQERRWGRNWNHHHHPITPSLVCGKTVFHQTSPCCLRG